MVITNRNRAGRLPVVCLVISTLASQAALHAAAISIISSSVAVQGRAGTNTYSGSNSGNTTGTTEDGSVWRASGSGSITVTGATLSAVSELIDGPGGIGREVPAESQVTLTSIFQPVTPNIIFNFTGSTRYHAFESYITFTVKDLAAPAITIKSANWAYDGFWMQDSLPYSTSLSLDVGHQYELVLFAKSAVGDYRAGHATLDLQIVPEPTSAALVAMGFTGMICRRSRRFA